MARRALPDVDWRSIPDADRRTLAILALAVCPWTTLVTGGHVTLASRFAPRSLFSRPGPRFAPTAPRYLLFPFGAVEMESFEAVDLYSYLAVHTSGLPAFLVAWPMGVLVYVAALANLGIGRLTGREDRFLTAGLLILVGLTQLVVALGLSRRLHSFALPVAPILAWALVWWFDWSTLEEGIGLVE